MDNQNLNTNTPPLFKTPPQPPATPTPQQPYPEIKPSFSTRIINWLRNNKKLAILLTIIILLIIATLAYFLISATNSSKNPSDSTQTPNTNQLNLPSITLTSPKTTYSKTDQIPVSIIANSQKTPITGFDVLIEYDPDFLTITNNAPLLDSFTYYNKTNGKLISIAAVQKIDSQNPQTLDAKSIYDLTFTPKKSGKTTLKMVYMPGSTLDSNLINQESKDILETARGIEITVQ